MNDFGSKIYDAAKKAVKEVYDLEPAEGQLIIETPQDTKLGDYSTSIAMKLSRTLRRNPMEIAEDATLNILAGSGACPWFLGANREETTGIQVDYLNGQETPTFRRSETVGQLGFVWDIWLDWGISVIDYRAFVKNPGAALPTL